MQRDMLKLDKVGLKQSDKYMNGLEVNKLCVTASDMIPTKNHVVSPIFRVEN